MKENPREHPIDTAAESLFAGPGEMRERCRALDWSATPIGPVSTWAPAMRAAVRLCLDCARPMCVFAGPELIAIYNEAYATAVGDVRHPRALARPARETWQDIWHSIGSEYEQVMAGGNTVDHVADSRYVVDRGHGLEETFWTWSTSPIRDDDGQVIGCHTLISESTARVQAERRAEGILERMQDAHCVLDREFTIVSVNASAERLLGRSRETLLGCSHWEAFPASYDAPVGRAFRRVVEEGVEQHLTHHYTGEGYDFHLEVDAYPTDDGGLAMFWRDVTERVRGEMALRESEERQRFLVRFSDAVRGLMDPSAVATTACRMLLEQLGVDRAHWGEVDWTTEEFVITGSVHSPGVTPLEGRFPLAAWEPCSASHHEGRAVAVDNTQTDPRADSAMRAVTARLEIGADLAVPVLVEGRLASVLAVKQRQPRHWTPAEIALVEGIAGRCWAEVKRARAEAALRESEGKYRALFTEMDEAYAVVEVIADEAGRWADFLFLDANPAFVRHTGMPYPVGRTATQLLGTPNPRWAELYGRVAETGEPMRVEESELTLGRTFDLNIFRLGDAGSRRIAVLFTDVTARKRAEAAIRASEERQAFLLALSDALGPLDAVADIQGEATRLLREHFAAGWCYYVEWDEAEALGIVLHDATRDGLPSLAGTHDVSEVPAFLDLLRKRNVLNVSDYASFEDLSPALRARYTALGFRSMLVATLVKQGRLVASLLVGDTEVRDWSSDAEALLMEVAERTWGTVERARAEAALRVSEARYRTIFESIDEGFAVAEVVYDDEGRPVDLLYLEANPAAARLTESTTLPHRRLSEVLPGADRTNLQIYDRVARTGKAEQVERYYAATDRWYEGHISRVIDAEPGGAGRIPPRVAIVFDDITERKREEGRRDFLLALSDALRPLADPMAIIATASEMVGRHLDAGRCGYGELPPPHDHFVVERDWTNGMPSHRGRWRLADFGDELVAQNRAGRTLVIDDALADERSEGAEEALHAAGGLRASIGVPLLKEGKWVAAFFAHDRRPRRWTEGEVEIVEQVAERTWAAVERARAELALRESEAKYRTLFESMDQGYCDAVLIRDGDGCVVDIRCLTLNPAFERLFGIPVAAAEGRRVREIIPDIEAWWLETYDRIARTQQSERFEHELSALGRWFDVHVYPRGGDRLTVLYDDVTQRKRADQALRESEERFRTMADLVPDLLWQSDTEGTTPWYNARWFEYTGQTPEESQGWGWTKTIHPDDRARSTANYARAAAHDEPLVQEHRIRRYDGEYRWFVVHAEPLRDVTGRVVRWIGAATDIHAQRMALEEAERLATERTAERDALRRQLAAAEEAERRRLARELHDQLGQQLTALALGLEDARRMATGGPASPRALEPTPVTPLLDRLDRLQALTHDMTMGARYLALELRPPELDDMGLENALATYVREWRERFGVAADLMVARGVRKVLPSDVASALYRITQEALTNVAKHARATSVSVIVEQVDDHVRLIVEDDGRGMELDAVAERARRERRLGLAGMQERAAMLGGEVKIESSPGHGTAVFVRLPLGGSTDQAGAEVCIASS